MRSVFMFICIVTLAVAAAPCWAEDGENLFAVRILRDGDGVQMYGIGAKLAPPQEENYGKFEFPVGSYSVTLYPTSTTFVDGTVLCADGRVGVCRWDRDSGQLERSSMSPEQEPEVVPESEPTSSNLTSVLRRRGPF
ncbi:MAG: hypothetical protein KDD69_09105 [Bdellovibrionales bacterium]|nr:hypothetical protein [Bdellovibrionales bacterium]